MSELRIDLPPEVRAEIARRVGPAPAAEAAWVAEAIRERLAAAAELEYLETRAARGSLEALQRVLASVPDAPPVPGDEL